MNDRNQLPSTFSSSARDPLAEHEDECIQHGLNQQQPLEENWYRQLLSPENPAYLPTQGMATRANGQRQAPSTRSSRECFGASSELRWPPPPAVPVSPPLRVNASENNDGANANLPQQARNRRANIQSQHQTRQSTSGSPWDLWSGPDSAFHIFQRSTPYPATHRLGTRSPFFQLFADNEGELNRAQAQNQRGSPPPPPALMNHEQHRASVFQPRSAAPRNFGVPTPARHPATVNGISGSVNSNPTAGMRPRPGPAHPTSSTVINNPDVSRIRPSYPYAEDSPVNPQFSLANASRDEPAFTTTVHPNGDGPTVVQHGHAGNINRMELRVGPVTLLMISTPVGEPQSSNRRSASQQQPQQEQDDHRPRENERRCTNLIVTPVSRKDAD